MRAIPRPTDCVGGEEHSSAASLVTTTPTLKRYAETRELAEAERLVAETHRSGVRAKAPAVDAATAVDPAHDAWTFDPSNAVTKVQRAVELDAFLPPSVEVTVVVSETISLGGSSGVSAPPVRESERGPPVPARASQTAAVDARVPSPPSAARAPARERPSPPSAARAPVPERQASPSGVRARRVVAALLVLAVMGGASALLVVAARRAQIRPPAVLVRVAERVVQIVR